MPFQRMPHNRIKGLEPALYHCGRAENDPLCMGLSRHVGGTDASPCHPYHQSPLCNSHLFFLATYCLYNLAVVPLR